MSPVFRLRRARGLAGRGRNIGVPCARRCTGKRRRRTSSRRGGGPMSGANRCTREERAPAPSRDRVAREPRPGRAARVGRGPAGCRRGDRPGGHSRARRMDGTRTAGPRRDGSQRHGHRRRGPGPGRALAGLVRARHARRPRAAAPARRPLRGHRQPRRAGPRAPARLVARRSARAGRVGGSARARLFRRPTPRSRPRTSSAGSCSARGAEIGEAAEASLAHLEARLWLEATAHDALFGACFGAALAFLALAAVAAFPRFARDLRRLRELPGPSSGALAVAIVLAPLALGEGPAGFGLGLLAFALVNGSAWRRLWVLSAGALMLVALFPLLERRAETHAALVLDPIALAAWATEQGTPDATELARVVRAAESDPLAARAVALRLARQGELAEAERRFGQLLAQDPSPDLLANSGRRDPAARGHRRRDRALRARGEDLGLGGDPLQPRAGVRPRDPARRAGHRAPRGAVDRPRRAVGPQPSLQRRGRRAGRVPADPGLARARAAPRLRGHRSPRARVPARARPGRRRREPRRRGGGALARRGGRARARLRAAPPGGPRGGSLPRHRAPAPDARRRLQRAHGAAPGAAAAAAHASSARRTSPPGSCPAPRAWLRTGRCSRGSRSRSPRARLRSGTTRAGPVPDPLALGAARRPSRSRLAPRRRRSATSLRSSPRSRCCEKR